VVKYSEAERARRPVFLGGGADSGGGVCGHNFDFGDNGWAAIVGGGKELKRKPPGMRSSSSNGSISEKGSVDRSRPNVTPASAARAVPTSVIGRRG
jgi:hypothetical protein